MQHSPLLAEGGLLAIIQQVVMFVHEPVCGARKVLVFAKSLLSFAWSAAEVTCLARCFCTVIPHRGLSSCTYDACAPCTLHPFCSSLGCQQHGMDVLWHFVHNYSCLVASWCVVVVGS